MIDRMEGGGDAGASPNVKRGRGPVGPVWERSAARVCGTHTHIGSVLFPFEQCQKEGPRGLSGRSKTEKRITCL